MATEIVKDNVWLVYATGTVKLEDTAFSGVVNVAPVLFKVAGPQIYHGILAVYEPSKGMVKARVFLRKSWLVADKELGWKDECGRRHNLNTKAPDCFRLQGEPIDDILQDTGYSKSQVYSQKNNPPPIGNALAQPDAVVVRIGESTMVCPLAAMSGEMSKRTIARLRTVQYNCGRRDFA